jgi:hypothetical protein
MKYSTYKDLCSTCGRKKKQYLSTKIYCLCGCGELIPSKTMDSTPQFYAQGHNIGKGINNRFYKGGTIGAGKGYMKTLLPKHPFSTVDGYVLTHRLILEKYLSEKYNREIYILPYFDVHHIDFNKNNNNPQNLMYIHRREHSALHKMNK